MITRRGFRLFEFFIVVAIFGVIVLVAISRYLEIGRETRRLGFELLAHHYTTAVAGARIQWLIRGGAQDYVELDGIRLVINPEGWPQGAELENIAADSVEPSTACLQLWRALLQNPMPATIEGQGQRGERRYHISLVTKDICRYELVTKDPGSYYFDYSAKTGQVLITVPIHKKIADL